MKQEIFRLAGIALFVLTIYSCNSTQEPEAKTESAAKNETASQNASTQQQTAAPSQETAPTDAPNQQPSPTLQDSAITQNTTAQGTSPMENERWIVTPNDLRGATGRLLLDFPPDTRWTVELWRMPQNESIQTFYNSGNKTSHVITPGTYRVKFNGVHLVNVPIQKGHDTKIYWGVLDIVSETSWEVINQRGDTTYINGYKPEKLSLPVGTYTLKLGGQGQPVTIRNGETTEM